MAFTKTVNYVQNTPVSLGYSDEISGATGEVCVSITYNAKAGRLNTETLGGISSNLGGQSCTPSFANTWKVCGTQAQVNDILNNLTWYPKAYNDANIEQDFLSEDREVTEYKGEVLIETEGSISGFSIGDTFKLDNAGEITSYTVSRKETSRSNNRMYGTLDAGYDTADLFGPDYKNIAIYDTNLLNDGDTVIGPITDYAIINPHGQYKLSVDVFSGGSLHNGGVTTMNGSLFVKEPYFTEFPPNEHNGNGPDSWTPIPMGTIAQDDNQLITVQVLIKRSVNDPAFDGDVSTNKPSYVTDNTYGCFNEVRVDSRVSLTYPDGVVRWSFYGSPEQCSKALQDLEIYTPPNPKDFYIETRIVNGRSRISHDRGYD